MATDLDSFSTYIDHLILLLAARFHAPLDVSVEELLPSSLNLSAEAQCPWELVACSVQQALRTPQTAQERLLMRHLDVHHFSASVCRERARYMQWKLQECRRRRGEKQQLVQSAAVPSAARTNTSSTAAANAIAAGQPCDVTCTSLHNDACSLYKLVRQSLPCTLGGTESDDDDNEDAQAPTASVKSVAFASEPSAFERVHEVFMRTPSEQERDELVARARDEFLSQVQALQSAYYDKYHRWMDVPASVLDPPPASSKQPASTDAAAAAFESAAPQHGSESERAALLGALGAAAPPPPRPRTQANYTNTSGAADRTEKPHTLASMLRQVQLRRPLRPSAVPDDVLESMYRARAESEGAPKNLCVSSGLRSSPPAASTSATPSFAVGSADAITAEAVAVASSSSQPSSSVAAVRKDTVPPASRRGRWQIVEYDDDDDGEG
ncbi:hypothetical protein conserved [Leishmania donovani]|uniref:Hypothetical_protein_conserved n=1 Tax=Leishmania donovani TaxID=5661 RepID=A0A504X5H8_LEIDO|nr:hypothetical protein CGC20_29505 [Leishmania donovani]CAJ1993441.1 hypothetical protein conserved [Leishmania donovani]VDZ49267.1 hypothetical_protein_conserved [Leishmania donovani]